MTGLLTLKLRGAYIVKHKVAVFILLAGMECISAVPLPGAQAASPPTPGFPFSVAVVQTPDEKEYSDITNKVIALFRAKDYDGLDAFSAKLRVSKDSWATGQWKLFDIYAGLVPDRQASDTAWQARLASLRDWVAARTNSMTARVALAYTLANYAWEARGSGYADTVSGEGWRLLEQRLRETVKVLDDAKGLKERCPVYWSVRMQAALGLQADKREFASIFSQATNSAPDYEAYYYRKAVYLLPRWYGEEGEWEADLAKSADRIGGEHGDTLYAQVVWCIHKSTGSTNMFKEYNLSWPRVNRGFEAINKTYHGALDARSEQARLAGLARDKLTARRCFDEIGGKVDIDIWRTQAEFERFALWAYRP